MAGAGTATTDVREETDNAVKPELIMPRDSVSVILKPKEHQVRKTLLPTAAFIAGLTIASAARADHVVTHIQGEHQNDGCAVFWVQDLPYPQAIAPSVHSTSWELSLHDSFMTGAPITWTYGPKQDDICSGLQTVVNVDVYR